MQPDTGCNTQVSPPREGPRRAGARERARSQLSVTRAGVQALFDLEATNQELKPHLRDLYITSAKEIETGAARRAIVVHVRT